MAKGNAEAAAQVARERAADDGGAARFQMRWSRSPRQRRRPWLSLARGRSKPFPLVIPVVAVTQAAGGVVAHHIPKALKRATSLFSGQAGSSALRAAPRRARYRSGGRGGRGPGHSPPAGVMRATNRLSRSSAFTSLLSCLGWELCRSPGGLTLLLDAQRAPLTRLGSQIEIVCEVL